MKYRLSLREIPRAEQLQSGYLEPRMYRANTGLGVSVFLLCTSETIFPAHFMSQFVSLNCSKLLAYPFALAVKANVSYKIQIFFASM